MVQMYNVYKFKNYDTALNLWEGIHFSNCLKVVRIITAEFVAANKNTTVLIFHIAYLVNLKTLKIIL